MFHSEHFPAAVGRFRYTVCIYKDFVPRIHLQRIFPVRNTLHSAYDETVPVFINLKETVLFTDRRVFMPRVGGSHFAGRDFQNAEPDGHKHVRLVVVAEQIIRFFQDLAGAVFNSGKILYDPLGEHHEQSRRYALSAHIRDHQA